ncbi:OsmC family protein [Chlorogloeopsis sp. ULAP01]|uniref:OsmC family protein n=1 Tax=Chlorogloeopsis sp. ULAP01 TaxID=3056483 RepID=UPI0025AABF61|nr:OsmC family protein [Chlorogloeopsis sp. ULAP01]MDM9382395.1 OsmC family protein [Chlorogloeopsis sp. ULAP01]
MVTQQLQKINGVDINSIHELVNSVSQDPAKGILKFQISTTWIDGPRSSTKIEGWEFGGQKLVKNFTINIDEPKELFGTNTAPNPQEMLMAAFNACVLATYVSLCSLQGIKLEKLEIATEGELDLRGFFRLDETVKPGYEKLNYTIHIKGDATPEQFQEIHQAVMAVSPNFWNMANQIKIQPQLQVL